MDARRDPGERKRGCGRSRYDRSEVGGWGGDLSSRNSLPDSAGRKIKRGSHPQRNNKGRNIETKLGPFTF